MTENGNDAGKKFNPEQIRSAANQIVTEIGKGMGVELAYEDTGLGDVVEEQLTPDQVVAAARKAAVRKAVASKEESKAKDKESTKPKEKPQEKPTGGIKEGVRALRKQYGVPDPWAEKD